MDQIKLNKMKKKHGFYEIENEAGLTFSVQRCVSPVEQVEDIVLFLVERIEPEEDLAENGDLFISITKNEAQNLIEQLKKLV